MTKRKSKSADKIDLQAALRASIKIKQDGAFRSVDPYEAMLRQHVRKSLIGRCMASIKFVLGEAERHKVIKPPPPPASGGVYVIPKELPEEVQRAIFDERPAHGEREPIRRIADLVLKFFEGRGRKDDGK